MDWSGWRRRSLTEPLYRRVRNGIAPLTAYQRHVLSAGDAWWEAQLLSGSPDWNALAYVRPAAFTEREQQFLDGPVAELCARLEQAGNDGETLSARELWGLLRTHRFEGMAVPVEYGGHGLSAAAQSELLRRVSLRSVATAYVLASRFVFGPAALLQAVGTQEQKARWLPRLAEGNFCAAVASFAVENDVVPIQAAGVVVRDSAGRPVLRLNWSGARHPPGPRPELLLVPFRLHDPEDLLGASEEGGVCIALVETSLPNVVHHPGCSTWSLHQLVSEDGTRHPLLPDKARGGVFDGQDVKLQPDAVLGGPAAIERGLSDWLALQSRAKGIALPALSAASVSLAAHASSALLRVQGEGSTCKRLGARSRLGSLAAAAYRVEASRRFLCAGLDLGYRPVLASALLGIAVFDDVRRSMGDSMELLGGAGPAPALTEWQESLHALLPALFGLDALAAQGRNTVVLSLGIMRTHPFLMKEVEALTEPDTEAGCIEFDKLVWKHLGLTGGRLLRALTRAWTAGRFTSCPRLLGPVARHYRRVNRYAAALSLIVEVLQPGARPVENRNDTGLERLLRALATLFALCAVLKRWQDEGRHEADLPLVDWCAADAFNTLDTLIEGILENLNVPVAGALLRNLLLPLGRRHAAPEDSLTLACADLLLEPSDTRERLVGTVWANHGLRHLSALERAYECVTSVQELREQIRQAGVQDWRVAHSRGGLTDAQAAALEAAETAVLTVLRS